MKNKLNWLMGSVLLLASVTWMVCCSSSNTKAEASGPPTSVAKFPTHYEPSNNGHYFIDTSRITIGEKEYLIFAQYQGAVTVVEVNKNGDPDTFSVPPPNSVAARYEEGNGDIHIIPKLRDPKDFYSIINDLEGNLKIIQHSGDVINLTTAQQLQLIALQSRLKSIQSRISDILLSPKAREYYQ